MMTRFKSKSLLVVVLAALSWTWAGAALGMPITVNFDGAQDSLLVGQNLSDPFESEDSDLLHFSHTTDPNGLFMLNDAVLTGGSNGLFVGGDFNDGALQIEMDLTANEISLSFGNDIFLGSDPAYEVVLTTYLGVVEVGQTLFTPNYDGVMNETISFDGALFDLATLKFDVDPQFGLAEAVDSVSVNVILIPEPGASILFGSGALLVAAACRRERRG
jgi:hypothetical protein